MKHLSLRRASVILALVGACSVPSVTYTGEDGGNEPPVDAPDVALVVSTNAVTVAEAGQVTFTISLSAPPSVPVLVSIDSEDEGIVGVSPSSIQIDSASWNTPRTVTLSGREDADTENESVAVMVTSLAGNATIAVTVTDNDSLSIVAAPSAGLQVSEGGTASLSVHLSAQPSATVTVAIASSDPAAATVSPTMLTFGTGTWDLDQNVVVSGEQDADTANATAMVMMSATGVAPAAVPIQVIDDDVLGILPSTTNLGAVDEGGTATFTVRLTQQPPGNVAVGVTSSDAGILAVSPASLAFTPTTWMTPQTVTITVPQDVDVADETAIISLAASGLTTRTVSASIVDDDTQVIIAAPDPVPVDEGGTRMLSVRLQYQPSADTTLTVTSLNTTVATVVPGTLTFTPASYNQNQTVIVSAPEDADAAAGMTTVRLESLADALRRDVTVAVVDNDQLLIETSTTGVTLGESGTTMFGARLTAMPSAPVSVSVSSGDPTVATVAPATLVFNSANYGTYQMVTVSGVNDVDLTNESLTLTLTATGLPAKTVDAAVTDDDMQQVVVSTSSLSVNEGGTGQVGVSLAFMPAAATTVTLVSADTSAATVSPTSLTFMPASYATPQMVTIGGANDIDAIDDSTTISATAPNATAASIAVTVQDDDALGIETSVTTTNVGEGATASFNVRLTAQPAATTTVMVTSSDASAATVAPTMLTFTTATYSVYQAVTLTGVGDTDAINDTLSISLTASMLATRTVNVTVVDDDTQDIVPTTSTLTVGEAGSGTFGVHLATMPASDVVVSVASSNANKANAAPAMLTFTPANYGTNQTVTVSGVADVDLSNDTAAINLSSPGLTTRAVTTTITDDDTQVIETSVVGTVNLTEGGAGAAVGFKLRFQPAADTTVTLTLGNGLAVAGGNTLVFTPANYNVEQQKTISAVQDADAADATTTVIASAPSATSATVNVSIDDDDTLGIDVSTLSLAVTEGMTASLGVKLTAQPLATTTVTVTSSDASVASISAGASLTFTTASWNVAQSVTIAGTDDADTTSEGATLTVASAGLASRTVGVTVTDDDMLTIVTSTNTLTLGEAGTATFGVHLSAMPPGDVVVAVNSSDTGASTAAPSSLVFTPSSYATNQTVTVTGVSDLDLANESVVVTLASTGLPSKMVTVTVTDDDTQEVLVSPANLPLIEGASGSFDVTLRFIPASTVTVAVAPTSASVASVSPSSLTFTPASYNSPQPVNVTALPDADAGDASTTIVASTAGATSGTVNVLVDDDEVLLVQTDVTTLGVTERGSSTFRVRLGAQPTTNVTVSISSSDPNFVTVQPTQLQFTSATYSTFQTVTVTAAQDTNTSVDQVPVILSAAGLPDASVNVVVVDDQATLLLSEVIVDSAGVDPEGEFIEIANPSANAVSLDHYYLSDAQDYFRLPTGTVAVGGTDFVVRFPSSASIPPRGVVTVAIGSAAGHSQLYGAPPTYAIGDMTMVNVFVPITRSLTNSGETVYLFYWDGVSDLVTDVDIMACGAATGANYVLAKTGLSQDGPDADAIASAYNADAVTLPTQQAWLTGTSGRRVGYENGTNETQTGAGNGMFGHDETSEQTNVTWITNQTPTPGVCELPLF